MPSSLRCCTTSAALLLVALATVGTAWAVPGDYFSSFGRVYNDTTIYAPGGECVAASFINGAVYLKNHYSSVYGSTNIAMGGTSSSKLAMEQFGSYGWAFGGKSYDGYYCRCGIDNNTAVFGDMWQTTIDWMQNSYAPGKTTFTGEAWTARSHEDPSTWTYGSNVTGCAPTYDFLHDAASKDKFVEMSVYTYTLSGGTATFKEGHALDLLDITANSITFQDPNNPGTKYTSALSTVTAWDTSALSFYDTYSFGSSPVMVLTAFTMSPAPEPSTIALVTIGVSGVLGYTWRKRRARR